ncbi:MAG: hypothetical protein K8F91_08075 [Candidatus Obscuribacterales bacterium]|nr:hypothetical protein [Candidatus Obscuribacterales bacterium]
MNKKAIVIFACLALQTLTPLAEAKPAWEITIPPKQTFNLREGLDYHASSQYRQEVENAINEAKKICQASIGDPSAAIVADLDETLLDSTKHYRLYHVNEADGESKFDHAIWEKYLVKAEADEIKPVADFVRWAHENKIAVFLITGRHEKFRKSTCENLAKLNIPFDDLFMETNQAQPYRAEDFKTDHRRTIERRGYRIICNIGDQWSDLYGLHCQECIKLPNRMYFTE